MEARKSGLHADPILETEAKMETDQSILAAKAHYEDKIVEQSKENPKRFWNYTRHYTRSFSTIDMLQSEGKKFTEDQDKAQILNSFFSSVLTNETPVDSSHHNSEGDGISFWETYMSLQKQSGRNSWNWRTTRPPARTTLVSMWWDKALILTSHFTSYSISPSRQGAHHKTGVMRISLLY